MDLNMQNNGKVFSKKYKDTQRRASISNLRATDEERAWTDINKQDAKLDPDQFRIYIDPPGARYEKGMMVDVRQNRYRHDSSLEKDK